MRIELVLEFFHQLCKFLMKKRLKKRFSEKHFKISFYTFVKNLISYSLVF